MLLFADHSPVPPKSRDPLNTAINYSALHYFWNYLSMYECKAAGALLRKCLHKVVIKIGTLENEELNSTVITFGSVESGGLTGL
jgi:hypothetical protein